MAEQVSLRIGDEEVHFIKSERLIAVCPRPGMTRNVEDELGSLALRQSINRREQIGRFCVIEIEATPQAVADERSRLLRTPSVEMGTAVYHTSDDGIPFIPQGTIYVEPKSDASDEDVNACIERHNLEFVRPERHGGFTVRVTGDQDAVEVAAALQAENVIDFAEPDLITPSSKYQQVMLPGDALVENQWHIQNQGNHNGYSIGFVQGADARILAAWKRLGNYGSSQVVIGIIDDGFDIDHPDLAGKSLHPWDFTRGTNDVRPGTYLLGEDDAHGTACAGVALARAGGGSVVGACPEARLIPVRWGPGLDPAGVALWFDHMTDNGADIVSCSWGSAAKHYSLPRRIERAITRCATQGRGGKGCIIFFAAGNSNHDINNSQRGRGTLNGFAIHPHVIAVAASTSMDERSHYSNFGKEVSICSPSNGSRGWPIVTTDVRGTYVDGQGIVQSMGYAHGAYTSFGGTSSACPLAAGVAGLVLSANAALTASEVREILESTARRMGELGSYDQNGHSIYHGYGCINAEDAVIEAQNRLTNVNLV